MQTYSCLIVDDEPPAREILTRYVAQMPKLHLAGTFGNAFQVIEFLHSSNVDIIFLDIQMPQLSGLELLATLINPPKIIFTTAFSDYAVQSYELDAIDYLLKPIKFERFIKAVNKAIPQISINHSQVQSEPKALVSEQPTFLYFRADRKMVKVVLKDILYVESLKDYVKIVTFKDKIITKYAISALEAMLSADFFLRIHRSYLIAIDKVQSFSLNHIQIDDFELPIGKLYQREVMKKLEG